MLDSKLDRLFQFPAEDRFCDSADCRIDVFLEDPAVAGHKDDLDIIFQCQPSPDFDACRSIGEVNVNERDIRIAPKRHCFCRIACNADEVVAEVADGILDVERDERLIFNNVEVVRHGLAPFFERKCQQSHLVPLFAGFGIMTPIGSGGWKGADRALFCEAVCVYGRMPMEKKVSDQLHVIFDHVARKAVIAIGSRTAAVPFHVSDEREAETLGREWAQVLGWFDRPSGGKYGKEIRQSFEITP